MSPDPLRNTFFFTIFLLLVNFISASQFGKEISMKYLNPDVNSETLIKREIREEVTNHPPGVDLELPKSPVRPYRYEDTNMEPESTTETEAADEYQTTQSSSSEQQQDGSGDMREDGAKLLNIEYDFRFPTVEPLSYKEGKPRIFIGKENFDERTLAESRGTQNFGTCGGEFTGIGGVIQSPQYPFNYPTNIHCDYKITVPSEYTIGLDCRDVSIQPGTKNCEYDYLQIFPNSTDDGDSDKYCGDHSFSISPNSSEIRLVFSTDSSFQYRGFMCRFRALNPDGTGVEGQILSDNSTSDHHIVCSGPGDSGWSGQCGVSMEFESRIVGGDTVRKHQFPWMVAVLRRCGQNGDHYCHICGGTVVHYEWILTGAHCVRNLQVSEMGLLLGDHNLYTLTPSQKFFRVKSIFIHPDFNIPSTLNNDIALLKTPQRMDFSRYIAPICLPPISIREFLDLLPEVVEFEQVDNETRITADERQDITTDKSKAHPVLHSAMVNLNISIYGWGYISDEGKTGLELREVAVKILHNGVCDYYYGLITDTMLCSSGEGGRGPCQGDSGSPAQVRMTNGRWVQVGVLAFGAAYGCEVGYPSGNALLPVYMDWITFVTGVDFSQFY